MKLFPRQMASAFIACVTSWTTAYALAGPADNAVLTFGVVSPRNAVVTAQLWNPILRHVSEQSGVSIRLKLTKSSQELVTMIRRGEFDFIFSNYQYAPGNDAVRYVVIARPLARPVRSQIIVPGNSGITSLEQLRGRDVAFASRAAFAGYHVPMDALLRAGIAVRPLFAATVEGSLGQVISGRAAAAGVSAAAVSAYAERLHLAYRVLWSSEEYPAIPIAAHPTLPQEKVQAVRAALLAMADNENGRTILAASAPLFGSLTSLGFVAADDAEYEHMRRFYRHRLASQENP